MSSKYDYLWFSPIKNTKGIYIKCESYPSFDEMEKFGGIVQKAHKQALTVASTLGGEGDGMQRRLRALERALKDVETLDAPSGNDAKMLED